MVAAKKLDIISEFHGPFIKVMDCMMQAINYAIAMALWITCLAGAFTMASIVKDDGLYFLLSKACTYLAASIHRCGRRGGRSCG